MKNLITGGTGLLGSALCRRLLASGEEVAIFTRDARKAADLASLGAQVIELDIGDRSAVDACFPDVDRVYHLAAAWRTEYPDETEYRRINVDATGHLLSAGKAHRIQRFVHCSTVGVHGNIDEPPADETYRFGPMDHYQRTKLEGELLARSYFAEGLEGVVVRPVGTYGPGDTRFLKLFRAIKRRRFVMIGTGETLFHMVYVDDMVEGLFLAGHQPGIAGEVFIIAGEEPVTLREFIDMISAEVGVSPPRLRVPYAPVKLAATLCARLCPLLGLEPPLYPRRVAFFIKDRAFRIDKAKRLLGYRPAVDLRTGIGRTARWYESQGLL